MLSCCLTPDPHFQDSPAEALILHLTLMKIHTCMPDYQKKFYRKRLYVFSQCIRPSGILPFLALTEAYRRMSVELVGFLGWIQTGLIKTVMNPNQRWQILTGRLWTRHGGNQQTKRDSTH
jgi:hypothetical protein